MYFIPEMAQLLFWRAKHKQQIVFYLYFYVPWTNCFIRRYNFNGDRLEGTNFGTGDKLRQTLIPNRQSYRYLNTIQLFDKI